MARFDVYEGSKGILLLDVRADQLERLGNYVLVPLIPLSSASKPIRDLNPVLAVGGTDHVLTTQLIAAAPRKQFGNPITNLSHYRDDIMRALDTLLTGF